MNLQRFVISNGRVVFVKAWPFRYSSTSSTNSPSTRSQSDKESIRIGCSSGFYGDTGASVSQLVQKGDLDFLVSDYLSEITMSLLTAAKNKIPTLGYAPEFVFRDTLPQLRNILERRIRIVSNAGGVNPHECAKALRQTASEKLGIDHLEVAVVSGDDILSQVSKLQEIGLRDYDSGQLFPQQLTSLHAYLGAQPIARALDLGAQIVVTGRCVDSALVLGPLLHSFRWRPDNWDLLSCGSLAGHLIECGAQVTGGIFTDWERSAKTGWSNIGFPLVECFRDGSFVVTKPPGTGGLVTPGTVSEQLLYEIGDPRAYQLPDVSCDWSQVTLKSVGLNQVQVIGARGRAPPPFIKLCGSSLNGYRLTAVAVMTGGRAAQKARRSAQSILARVENFLAVRSFKPFSKVHVQVLGAEESYSAVQKRDRADDTREVVLWLAATHSDRVPLETLAQEIAPAGTGMAPGFCAVVGGRPKVSPVLTLHSALLSREYLAPARVELNDVVEDIELTSPAYSIEVGEFKEPAVKDEEGELQLGGACGCYRLEEVALARSGDKGDTCNIGVVARHSTLYPYLKRALTANLVAQYFAHLLPLNEGGPEQFVTRYEAPGILGLNFVLKRSLGGGGVSSLRPDPQGKAYAQMLLDLKLSGFPDVLPHPDDMIQ